MIHEAKKKLTFNGEKHYCTTVNPMGPPVEAMFERKITELRIEMSVLAMDGQIKKEINEKKEKLRKYHKGHGDDLNVTTKDQFVENYFVKNCPISQKYKIVYKIIHILGQSLWYRCIVYFLMNHVTYKIDHKIAGEESVTASNSTENKKFFVRVTNSDKTPFYDIFESSKA